MKKLSFISLLLVAIFSSCNSIVPNVSEVEGYYSGTVKVLEPLYVQEDVKVLIERDSITGVQNIVMYKVRFSERMPVFIDMVIPDVDITKSGYISGDSIVPLLKSGAPYEKYIVTELEGQVDNTKEPSTLTFSLNFGQYPTQYTGKWVIQDAK